MAKSGVGEGSRRRRRSSFHRLRSEYGDDRFDADTSEGNSFSSCYDDMDIKPRDKAIDDALFGFFKRESVKNLKRNFYEFCKDAGLSPSNKDKRRRIDGVDRSVFTRFSVKYFVGVIKKLTQKQRSVIVKSGFGCLLLLDVNDIPSEFARWVADCIDPVCSQIEVQGRTFDISKRTFHVILGLPIGGSDIPCNNQEGQDFILGHFRLSAMPHVTFFGNKLCGTDVLSDQDVFVCFMVVALHCFLCPSLEEHISGNYLSALKQPETVKDHDFSKLVYDNCLASLNHFSMMGRTKGRRLRAPLCCNYVLAVRYLDCLDFGRQNVDQTFPRVAVWKGNMIKLFSELDRKKRNLYGKRQLKDRLASECAGDVKYHSVKSPVFLSFSPNFRKNVHSNFASNIRPDIIDGIITIAESGVSSISASNKPKFELLVTNVLEFLRKSNASNKPATVGRDETKVSNVLKKVLASNTCERTNTVGQGELKLSAAPTRANNVCITSNQQDPAIIDDIATPDCFITKVVPANTSMTAPGVNPLNKVKQRRCNLISAAEEDNLISKGATIANMQAKGSVIGMSPIAPFVLSDSPVVQKQPQTVDFKINRQYHSKAPGSIQVPILVAESSPKPQLVGSNEFRRRCSELGKKADMTYNNILAGQMVVDHAVAPRCHSLFEHHVEEPLNVRVNAILCGRHKHMFLNFMMRGQNPPLQHNNRFIVSEDDIINYSAIVELGHNDLHKKSMGVKYPEVHCNYQSLGESLMPGGEVDNFILTCFCRLLFKEKHPSSSGRHYFFPLIGEAILKYQIYPNDNLIRTTFEGSAKASKGRNLGSGDNRLFFPIVESHHWFVFVVDFDKKLFAFLDSLNDRESEFHRRKKNVLIDNFIHLWELFVSRDHNFGNFRYMYPNVPKQQNLLDCGIYAMKSMESWKPSVDLRNLVCDDDILNLRVDYAIRLFFHNHNETDTSLVTDYYTQG